MTPLRIVVRTSTPWESMTAEKFASQLKNPVNPVEFLRAKNLIPLWEEATGRNFFQFRAEVRTICEAKLREIAPVIVGIENIDWDGPDEILCPIDDDDVFFPSLPETLRHWDDETNIVSWIRMTNYLGTDREENPHFGGQFDTCNWSVRKSFLLQWPLGLREMILAKHWLAAGLICERINGYRELTLIERAKASLAPKMNVTVNHPSVKHVYEKHSLYYLHSASISFLHSKMTAKHPVEHIRRLPFHPLWEAEHVQSRAAS